MDSSSRLWCLNALLCTYNIYINTYILHTQRERLYRLCYVSSCIIQKAYRAWCFPLSPHFTQPIEALMSDYIRCNNSRGRVFFRKCSTFCAIFSRWKDELTTRLELYFYLGNVLHLFKWTLKESGRSCLINNYFRVRYICTNILNLLFKWFWNAIHFSKCVCVWSGYFHKFRYIIIMFFGGVNGWNSNKTHLKCPVVFPTENGVHNFSCVRYVCLSV